jgi:hypothetical protein
MMWADATAILSSALGPAFRLIAPLHPVWQGVVLGLPIAVLALAVYRVASNQTEITRTKDGIKANLLALQLFRDDLRLLMRIQAAIFRLVGRYLRLGLVPLAFLIGPFLVLLIQVEARQGHRPAQVGEATNIVVELDGSAVPTQTPTRLLGTSSLRIETPAFRRDSERMVAWRVSAIRPGPTALEIHVGDDIVRRTLWAGRGQPELLIPDIYRATDWRSMGSPGEPGIQPSSQVFKASIDYQPAAHVYGGLSLASWSMIASSLLGGFALRRRMNVDF